MSAGTPRIGQGIFHPEHDSEVVPQGKVLGEISTIDAIVHPLPKTAFGANADVTEDLPPWERDPKWTQDNTDARRFVDVPDTWELRWINPRMLDQFSWRDWQPVMVSDTRVTLKVPQMRSPEGNVRRGYGGDILAFMPKTWVESRKRLKAERVAQRTRSAPERMQQFKEQAARGKFGPYIKADTAKHPTHTMGDGRTMTD